MCTICFLLYIYGNNLYYICEYSCVTQKHKLFHNVSNKKLFQNAICQNTFLPVDICTNTDPVYFIITSVLSINKYMCTCIMYVQTQSYGNSV